MSKLINRFAKDESGATAIEYGMLCALMALAVIAAVTAFSGTLTTAFEGLGTRITGAALGS